MTQAAEKHSSAIDDGVSRLLSRAVDARGLGVGDLRPRVAAALGKYLLKDNENAERRDVSAFVDELRADDV